MDNGLLWLGFHEKSEVGEVDMRYNCASKAVHLAVGSRKLLHLDWNILVEIYWLQYIGWNIFEIQVD